MPGDLPAVGLDNIPEAAHLNPALTTVDQFIDNMGYVAAVKLVDLVQGDDLEGDLYRMPTELIVRDSCRAVAGYVSAG